MEMTYIPLRFSIWEKKECPAGPPVSFCHYTHALWGLSRRITNSQYIKGRQGKGGTGHSISIDYKVTDGLTPLWAKIRVTRFTMCDVFCDMYATRVQCNFYR